MAGSSRTLTKRGSLVLLLVGLTACGGGITPIQTAYNKGAYQYSAGNYDAAITEYEDALREDPEDVRARFNLGLALESRADRYEAEARAEARRLRARGDDSAAAGVESAARDKVKDLVARAEEEYRTIIEEDPTHPRATVNLAAIEYERGDEEAAKDRLRALIAVRGDDAVPRVALAAHLINEEALDAARELLVEAREDEPASAGVNGLLGDVARKLGRNEEAREAYATVLKRDADDLHALVAMGALAVQEERWDNARGYLERALYVHPRHYRSHVLLAEVYERQGDDEDAARHLWDARDLEPLAEPGDPVVDFEARLRGLYGRLLEGVSR